MANKNIHATQDWVKENSKILYTNAIATINEDAKEETYFTVVLNEPIKELTNGLLLLFYPDDINKYKPTYLQIDSIQSKVEIDCEIEYFQSGYSYLLIYRNNKWQIIAINPENLIKSIPVNKGGTGRNTLGTNNFLVGYDNDQMKSITPNEVLELIGAATASHSHTAADIGAATTFTKTVTISASSWTVDSTSGIYTKSVNVAGILATDTPLVDVVLYEDVDSSKASLKAWACIDRITTADGSIKLYAYTNKPSTNIQINLKVVR